MGAGSIGLTFGATLARGGHLVTVLGRPRSAEALLSLGSVDLSGQLAFTVPVTGPPARPGRVAVIGQAADIPAADAILFTPKGQDLAESIEQVARARPDDAQGGTWVAGFQNGVVKDELLAAAFGSANVVGAASVLGARRASAGDVYVAGLGTTYFGEFGAGSSSRTELITTAFLDAGLPCIAVPEIRALLWAKFCNAVGVFGVTALTGLPTVEIFARAPLAFVYRSLLEEAAAVAAAEGVVVGDFPDLPMRTYLEPAPEDVVAEMTRRAVRRTDQPPGYSSMAQDLAAGRRTEVEETFGDLVRRARSHGIDVPRSELVYRVVRGF
ncbi:MAG TPA: 2-dehydropantoate 2-reductase, partial [Acidimicrobiales bacterium]|nr:2-dehydropantoate 2-reductase [Acidimicrobiales bacterium]